MRPAELALARDVLEIRGQPITAEDPRKGVAEHGLQHVRAPRGSNVIDDERACDERPEPALVAVGPMTGLIDVENRLVPQRRGEFGRGRGHRRTGFFPGSLRAPETDGDLQRAFQEPLDHQTGHAADHGEICHERRQLRAELADMFVRQRGQRGLPTRRALTPVTTILGAVRGDRRQLGDLMAPRRTHGMARVQSVRAVPTRIRSEIHDRIDARGGDQRTMAARVSRLAARLPPTLHTAAPDALMTGETIGRRRF